MDKKLTDSEIVKALEEHYKQVDKGYSTHLEYGGKGDEHEEKYVYMLRDVLDLINRQKSEIERLHKEVGYWEAETKEARADIDQAVAEAYKECVEKVKDEKFKTSVDAYTDAYILGEDDLDNLLKELVGDNQ